MIRMTLALVVAIAAVMMIWGQPQERAEGSDQPGSPTEIEEVAASRNVGEVTRLALDDDLGAYEIALAASRVKLETPIPHQSSLSSTIMP